MHRLRSKEYVHLEGKRGEEDVASSLKLNLTDPFRVPCQYHGWGMPRRQAGSPIAVLYMREYIAESPKQGRKRFTSIVKTIGFDHLVII